MSKNVVSFEQLREDFYINSNNGAMNWARYLSNETRILLRELNNHDSFYIDILESVRQVRYNLSHYKNSVETALLFFNTFLEYFDRHEVNFQDKEEFSIKQALLDINSAYHSLTGSAFILHKLFSGDDDE